MSKKRDWEEVKYALFKAGFVYGVNTGKVEGIDPEVQAAIAWQIVKSKIKQLEKDD